MNIKDKSLIFQKKYIPGDIFKQAPVAYAPVYMEMEMKGHSGRMEYRAGPSAAMSLYPAVTMDVMRNAPAVISRYAGIKMELFPKLMNEASRIRLMQKMRQTGLPVRPV